jgi:hypothetical protein
MFYMNWPITIGHRPPESCFTFPRVPLSSAPRRPHLTEAASYGRSRLRGIDQHEER